MAYYVDPTQPKNKQQSGQVTSPDPTAGSNGGGSAGSQAKPANQSGQFLSIDRLMNANQGAGQGEANGLAYNVNNQADSLKSATSAASNVFNTDAQKGQGAAYNYTAPPAAPAPSAAAPGQKVAGFNGRAASVNTTQNDPFAAAAQNVPGLNIIYRDPTGTAAKQYAPQTAAATTATQAQYTGPTDPSSYFANAQNQAASLAGTAGNLNTLAGRQSAVGGSLLDALLMGNDPAIAAARKNALGATQGLSAAIQNAGGTVANAQNNVSNYVKGAQAQLGNVNKAQAAAQQQMTDHNTKVAVDQNNAAGYGALVDEMHGSMYMGRSGQDAIQRSDYDAMTPAERAAAVYYYNRGNDNDSNYLAESAAKDTVNNALKRIRGGSK